MGDIFKLFEPPAARASIEKQSLDSLSDVEPEQDHLVRRASLVSDVDLQVDYSDLQNFISFNSAYEYFTITGDKIINEYPTDGTVDDLQSFSDSLDGYQRYVLANWPARIGHLRFNPASGSYVKFDDIGVVGGVTRTSLLSAGTGTIAVQAWYELSALTGSNDVQILFQKIGPSSGGNDGIGYTLYASGSAVRFRVTSGSVAAEVSAAIGTQRTFVAAVHDRTALTGTLYILTGSTGEYPVVCSSASSPFYGRLDAGSGSFFIGSGSLQGKVVVAFTGSVDDVSVWNVPRGAQQLTSSYNRKLYAQPGMLAAWRFNESAAIPDTNPTSAIVKDCSGHRLDGRIQSYYGTIRASGSLAYDRPDPIIALSDPNVVYFIDQNVLTGSAYDATNSGKITDLVPREFVDNDSSGGRNLIRNFLYIIARQLDSTKLYIDQLVNLMRVDYDDFDVAPDAILDEVGKFFGWEFTGNFLSTDALQYLLGRSVVAGPAGNNELDRKLYEIKNDFWRRTLLSLSYLYKTKGTRESVESLLRVYGVDSGFVRLKEYDRKVDTTLKMRRADANKSVYALSFGVTSSAPVSPGPVFEKVTSPTTYTDATDPAIFSLSPNGRWTVETRVKFPLTSSLEFGTLVLSGSLMTLTLKDNVSSSFSARVCYERSSLTSHTGNLYVTSSAGRLVLASASIFNDQWTNVAVCRDSTTGSLSIFAVRADQGEIILSTSSICFSGSVGCPIQFGYDHFVLGSSGLKSQFWAQEARVWSEPLRRSEIEAHALHFESFGRERFQDNDGLELHWRLNDAVSSSAGGLFDVHNMVAGRLGQNVGKASNYVPSRSEFRKFLFEYSYPTSPSLPWGDDRVRVFSSTEQSEPGNESSVVALEFNMVDALDQDISLLMSSFEELNDVLGAPVNKYRESYDGLEQMRETYFKRLQGRLRFGVFARMLEFFDRTFIAMVRRLIPARVNFIGDEFIVESHMLERPKYQYGIRPVRDDLIEIAGTIMIVDRE